MNAILGRAMPFIYGAVVLLIVLLASTTWHLNRELVIARADLATLKTTNENNIEVAKTCSASVTRLEDAANKRDEIFAPVIQVAAEKNTAQQKKATVIMVTPPTTPGNDCKSASDRARTWLQGRTK